MVHCTILSVRLTLREHKCNQMDPYGSIWLHLDRQMDTLTPRILPCNGYRHHTHNVCVYDCVTVGLKLGSRDPHGLPNGPLQVCNSESVQMEPNGPVRVHLVPFVHSQSYGGRGNHCATLNGTEPSLVSLVTPVKEVIIWLLCIEPIEHRSCTESGCRK